MLWDIFCRVVDNYGDIGVCWRLAADLSARGERVRLYVDDARALAWMAPCGAAGVTVANFARDPVDDGPDKVGEEGLESGGPVGEVVIEAFGCDLPSHVVRRMAAVAAAGRPPVWINLEYLSAEADVERSHRLVSPQLSGPGAGLRKHFFYPGFTAGTGGLLREPGLLEQRAAFGKRDAVSFLRRIGVDASSAPVPVPASVPKTATEPRPEAPPKLAAMSKPMPRPPLLVSVFAYDVASLPDVLRALGDVPVLVLATAGLAEACGAAVRSLSKVRVHALPWLTQPDYDRLLWSCDLNLVRGEDSFVRAQWAGEPFLWQIYPQHDGVHRIKLEAFLERLLSGVPAEFAVPLRAVWMRWNRVGGAGPEPRQSATAAPSGQADRALPGLPLRAWRQRCHDWRDGLAAQRDLSSQLIEFVAQSR